MNSFRKKRGEKEFPTKLISQTAKKDKWKKLISTKSRQFPISNANGTPEFNLDTTNAIAIVRTSASTTVTTQ